MASRGEPLAPRCLSLASSLTKFLSRSTRGAWIETTFPRWTSHWRRVALRRRAWVETAQAQSFLLTFCCVAFHTGRPGLKHGFGQFSQWPQNATHFLIFVRISVSEIVGDRITQTRNFPPALVQCFLFTKPLRHLLGEHDESPVSPVPYSSLRGIEKQFGWGAGVQEDLSLLCTNYARITADRNRNEPNEVGKIVHFCWVWLAGVGWSWGIFPAVNRRVVGSSPT